MTAALSLPLRRFLALTVLLILLLLVWAAVVHPALDLAIDRQEEIASLSEQLSNLRTAIGRRPDLQRQVRDLQADGTANAGLWPGSSAAAVAADIQKLVRQALASGNGQLKSTSEESGTTEQGFRRVVVHLNMQGTLQAIESVLDTAEKAVPFLFVDSLTVTAPESNVVRDRPPLLALDLNLVGYMRAQSK